MNRQILSKGLIVATIILIAAFQFYWITRLYKQEFEALRRETDVLFREVVYKLQIQRFKNDTALFQHRGPDNLFAFDVLNEVRQLTFDSMDAGRLTGRDSLKKRIVISHTQNNLGNNAAPEDTDSLQVSTGLTNPPTMLRYVSGSRNVNDSLPLNKIDSAYKSELAKNNIFIGYTLKCMTGNTADLKPPESISNKVSTNFTFAGLSKSYAYQAEFGSVFSYLLGKLRAPIMISVLLIAFTIISFVFLYRNLKTQQRLASIKNEFISNITHELKTPIATVNVAIEALRNFNALQDPVKTKEYLDISASELQRLSLLVDKVLRLSMFENGQVELKKQKFDLKVLAGDVISIMQLQVDKQKAVITLRAEEENYMIEADRMHITSVLYNLLDNALKYKRENPAIEVELTSRSMHIELKVKDNGIGIPAEYRSRIFEKLFRVPTDDVHNIKGYGLGLSYVNYIVRKHHGFIEVDSEPGKGSVFTVHIPYKEMNEIWFDNKRRIRKLHFGLFPKTNL